jgi:hypothetical protein
VLLRRIYGAYFHLQYEYKYTVYANMMLYSTGTHLRRIVPLAVGGGWCLLLLTVPPSKNREPWSGAGVLRGVVGPNHQGVLERDSHMSAMWPSSSYSSA